MEVQAYIEIKPDGHGEFQFGLVSGQIDGEVIINGTKEPEKSRRKNHENQKFVLWLSRRTRMVNQHDSGSSDSNQCDLHFGTGLAPVARGKSGWEGNGAIIAYDLNTGNEKWRWAGEGPEYASPILLIVDNMKQIVTIAEKSIVGVGMTDGKLLWQLPFVPQGRGYNAATPIVDGQTVIFTGASRGTNAVKIEKQGDGFVTKELWSNKDVAVQFNTPVLKEGLLFGLTDKDTLFCLNAQTGQTAWIDTTRRGSGGLEPL